MVEFFFGLAIFGIVSAACFPLGIVAIGIGSFALLAYIIMLRTYRNHQHSSSWSTGQAKFEQNQRTEMAEFLVRNEREQPWNDNGRIWEERNTPYRWVPTHEDMAKAQLKFKNVPNRTYTRNDNTGKWSRHEQC